MGKRQNILASLLNNNGINLYYPIIIDRGIFSQSQFHQEMKNVYHSLGGILEEYPIHFGDFDMIGENFFVELDEENHFNRYRKTTLQSSVYNNYEYFHVIDYNKYCDFFGTKGGKIGNFWTTPKSEKQFGKSSPERDFSGNGPARWKQRAFYDLLKDVYGMLINKPVFRFSTYEKINDISINNILKNKRMKLI
ncbi:MAG: hypothetical protein IPI65_13585 [Bacteroidetes bacterium]|nr:hypothetical protein [Bacteroidota bacterium]